MPECHCRIRNESDEVLKSIVLWSRSQGKVYIAVQEVGKNDGKHIHLIIDTAKTISTFRQNFLKEFPALKGNQSYSMKQFEKDLDHNIRYCCKGSKTDLPHILFTSLSQNEIEQAHKKFWEEQEKYLIEHGVKPEEKGKKERQPNFIEKVMLKIPLELKQSYVSLQAMYKPSDYEKSLLEKDRQDIMDICIICLGRFAKTCDDLIVTRLINGVFLKIVTDYGDKEQFLAMSSRIKARIGYNLY